VSVLIPFEAKFRELTRLAVSYDLQNGICRSLNFSVDYSDESHHDILIRNPSVQLCLTVQNSLGFNGDTQRRSFGGKIAWISLQARNCIVLMTMASSMKVPDSASQKKIAGLEDPGKFRGGFLSKHYPLRSRTS
jgi:mediator of RNA polymerase II transcription subunit 16